MFKCPIENCNRNFTFEGNMTRHVKQFHNKGSSTSIDVKIQKQHVCPEIGCGKVFKFASKLEKLKDSRVKLDSIETVCLYPGCMKHFTSIQCLRAHTKSCHQYVTCETCGENQLEKNIKRHFRKHENSSSSEGDFEETDEQFRSRNREGRKRKCPTVEMLIRKRVAPPTQLELLMKAIV
ncbi:hypothetical protein TSUD_365150 [Trifolium subterraneum]|uniref:C2H2-type domain-containing protein n=1 Tax=Trifolium subterraneum TaxID=3900 RepID=A0A2Z6MYN9_TRISU|nr:hypothetical protein TSUD_365150 [Trifolium subterraneum]